MSYEVTTLGRFTRIRPISLVGFGADFVAPTTPPPFSFSVPDGKGGWVTVGTLSTDATADTKKVSGPPAAVMGWVQLAAAGAGALVGLGTLYLMTKKKTGKQR